ncbi:Uncharacterised protein [Mycobacteroides abscessus subsp. massiliense]|nr:Uncharacterised protein [Mycobacteroides abscessus subsp. massiliense]
MPERCGTTQRRLRRNLDIDAQRGQVLAQLIDHHGVFVAVLVRAREVFARAPVLRWITGPRGRTGERMTDHHVSVALYQQLRAAAHHGVSTEPLACGGEVHAETVGVGVVSDQPMGQHQGVHRGIGL